MGAFGSFMHLAAAKNTAPVKMRVGKKGIERTHPMVLGTQARKDMSAVQAFAARTLFPSAQVVRETQGFLGENPTKQFKEAHQRLTKFGKAKSATEWEHPDYFQKPTGEFMGRVKAKAKGNRVEPTRRLRPKPKQTSPENVARPFLGVPKTTDKQMLG